MHDYKNGTDLNYIRKGGGTHRFGDGDDIIFVATNGPHKIYGGAGNDLVVMEGAVADYYLVRHPKAHLLWGGGKIIKFADVEHLLFRTRTDASYVIDLADFQKEDMIRFTLNRTDVTVADDAGETIVAINDGCSLKGGAGSDRFVAIGRNTRLILDDIPEAYSIINYEDGTTVLRHPAFGEDLATGVELFEFTDGSVLHAAGLPTDAI
ncbi:hypothetical protein [Limoniibacter endophyticus]|nr:hypothetical protein [Limoniibacter endophyticus]